jgi:hypothetical protein
MTHNRFQDNIERSEESLPVNLRAKNTTITPSFPSLLGLVGTASTTFTDYNGQKAVSAYWGRAPSSGAPFLPSLWSFQFYVVFGATADSDRGLPEQLLAAPARSMHDRYPIRLDVNFLPSADPERCMDHYRAEKAARQKAGAPLLVTDPYGEAGVNFSFLVMIEHADWESMGATTVVFDDDDPDEPGKVLMSHGLEWGNLSRNRGINDKLFVGETLHSLKYETPAWDLGNELYDEMLEQGRSDWS